MNRTIKGGGFETAIERLQLRRYRARFHRMEVRGWGLLSEFYVASPIYRIPYVPALPFVPAKKGLSGA